MSPVRRRRYTGVTNTVIADMTMSLDGFIADPQDGCEELFGWFSNGPVAVPAPGSPGFAFQTSEASARHLRSGIENVGALVCGRRLFDYTNGWDGSHPMGVPVVVVSHRPAAPGSPFTFTGSVESAIAAAKELAGPSRWVGVASASIARQCLELGLLDEIRVSLAPVLLGKGIPWFADVASAPVRLSDPEIVAGTRVTHLYYKVLR